MQFLVAIGLVVVLLLYHAARSVPSEPGARLRLLVLATLVVPWAIVLATTPLLVDHHALDAEGRAARVVAQYVAAALFLAAALAGTLLAHGGRACAASFGLANLLAAFPVVTFNIVALDPGSS